MPHERSGVPKAMP